jgi:hypothetical protein
MIKDKAPGRLLLLVLALSVFLAAGSGAEGAQKAPKTSKHAKSHRGTAVLTYRPGLEPKAIDILKAASDRLAAARTMSFTVVVFHESPSRFGHPLVYATKTEVAMQRPDKLRMITPGDGSAGEFYYNGKTMIAFEPEANLVAIAEAPPTIEATLKKAYDLAAIYFPFVNLVTTDPYQGLAANGLKHAFYIGQSKVVGGTTTDMVAVVDDGAFQQFWIGAEDKLIRRVRVVFFGDPRYLRHDLEVTNWQIDPEIPADAFAWSNTTGAARIEFARPDAPKPSLGVRGQAKRTAH